MKNSIKATLTIASVLALSGCVAVPVAPYYGGPPAAGYYSPGPAYYGPSLGIGIYGGRGYGGGGYGGGRRGWR